MKARLIEFQTDCKSLTIADIEAASDFNAWLVSYGNYILKGGDRPPKKPPTP